VLLLRRPTASSPAFVSPATSTGNSSHEDVNGNDATDRQVREGTAEDFPGDAWDRRINDIRRRNDEMSEYIANIRRDLEDDGPSGTSILSDVEDEEEEAMAPSGGGGGEYLVDPQIQAMLDESSDDEDGNAANNNVSTVSEVPSATV